jgi:tRNA (cytidine32/uridine32-2'-O)-methyltransferase
MHTTPGYRPDIPEPAPFGEVEGMYSHIEELLIKTGYLWADNPDHMMRAVRGFVNRANPGESDVRMIRGICRKLLRHLRNPETGKG